MTPTQREAMQVLDLVRAGVEVPPVRVNWALAITGDLSQGR